MYGSSQDQHQHQHPSTTTTTTTTTTNDQKPKMEKKSKNGKNHQKDLDPLQPVRFFKNPPEIMQSYRVLQDTHYYILLTVGTGISVSGRFKNELSETQTRTFFVLHLFYFPSQWYVQRELVGMILKSRFGTTEPPSSKKSLALASYGSHRWSMFLFPSKRELMEHITYSGNLNGVQTQPASSSGKDEPPPRKRMLYPLLCSISWGYLAGWFVV